ARRVGLPTYAFQHQHYWPEPPKPAADQAAAADPADAAFWEAVEREDLSALPGGGVELSADTPLGEVLPALASWRTRRRRQSTIDNWRYHATWKPL
ncbi:hypothetical protein, partial [Streptomyces sp. KLOTTS4A1]|uniref:hypothetical protein n=1 Tax=Streptomyces sp. KLOTTS4A1 TaxID=3390996 RepID=UPI0039F49D6D